MISYHRDFIVTINSKISIIQSVFQLPDIHQQLHFMQCLGRRARFSLVISRSRSVTVSVPFSTLASAARRIFPRKWIISSSSAICLRMDNTPASCCVACKRVLNRNTSLLVSICGGCCLSCGGRSSGYRGCRNSTTCVHLPYSMH